MGGVAVSLDAIVVAATVVGLATAGMTGPQPLRRSPTAQPAPASAPLAVRSPSVARGSWLTHPGTWLALVVAVVYVNQVLFTIYVIRVRHGDVSFVADHLPSGWFALAAKNRLIMALAGVFPAPHLLAPSVLRVQAVLELPLVVLAYLSVCHWFDVRLYRRLASPPVIWSACASYTVTFCLIEWSLRNPYTADDLVLRVVSGVVTATGVVWLARRDADDAAPGSQPRSSFELITFVASAAALAYLVLAVYDTALLYNLGHLSVRLPGVVGAGTVLGLARLAARRRPSPDRAAQPDAASAEGGGGIGPGVGAIAAALGQVLALFFVPALAIRYALGFATPTLAVAAVCLITFVAAGAVIRQMVGLLSGRGRRLLVTTWLAQVVAALAAASLAASISLAWPADYPETRMLWVATIFLAVAIAVCTVTDRWWLRTRLAGGE